MKTFVLPFTLLIAILTGTACIGAEIVLRDQAIESGSIIRLGDIADIGASSSAELNALANTPLLPTPAKGTQQFLTVAQVRDLLRARGVQLDAITIQGATVVEIGMAESAPELETELPVKELTPADWESHVRGAIEQHLASKSNSRWRVELRLTGSQESKLAELPGELAAHSQQPLRSGNHRFLISGSTGQSDVIVFAKITQIQPVVVALRPIERGAIVRRTDVEIQDREGNLPKDSQTTIEQVIGKESQRQLTAGNIIQASHIRAPWQVRRGETVSVFVRTGGIVVRTRAVAKENGAMGDLIVVETLGEKQKLNVSVSGASEVTIHATGGQTADYATLQRDQRRR